MSGLIWAGIGKGIADAGTSVGNMMFKGIESDMDEKRALIRASALERLKADIAEEAAQRDAAKALEIDARAVKIGEERAAKLLGTDAASLAGSAQRIAGDSPAMTAEEMKAHLESLSPAERKAIEGTGLISRSLTPQEKLIQQSDDEIRAARELGASSTLLKSYQDAKKTVLEKIRLDNADKKADQQYQATIAAITERGRQFDEKKPIEQQKADAATTRAGAAVTSANRPRGSGSDSGNKPVTGVDLERAAKAAEKALALELGVPVKDLQSEVARLRKRGQITPAMQEKLDDYNSSLTRWKNYKSDTKPSSSGDNTGTRPPLSSFMR